MFGPNNGHIVEMTMLRTPPVGIAVFSDGLRLPWPLIPNPFKLTSRLTELTYTPAARTLLVKTIHGDSVVAELPTPQNFSPRNNRTIVYLDQKDWSTLANAIYDPERIESADELAAAQDLIKYVQSGKVILPMSGAHLAETCKWQHGERRYRLAVTILKLSAGWQMRDPITIRKQEIRKALAELAGEEYPWPDVFTLEPYSISFTWKQPDEAAALLAGLDNEMKTAFSALGSTSGYFDTMLDSEAIPNSSGRAVEHREATIQQAPS